MLCSLTLARRIKLGGNSSEDQDQFNGLFSLFGIDFGIYIGPSYNLFERIGPSIGAGLLIGQNGFLAGKVGIHFNRTFGLAILIPRVPIYGAMGASFLYPLCRFCKRLEKLRLRFRYCLCRRSFAYQEELRKLCRSGQDKLEGIRRWRLRLD